MVASAALFLIVGFEAYRKIRTLSGGLERVILRVSEVIDPMPPRKTSKRESGVTVPQTDTRGQGEYPEALEITSAKELGKIAP